MLEMQPTPVAVTLPKWMANRIDELRDQRTTDRNRSATVADLLRRLPEFSDSAARKPARPKRARQTA